MSALHESTTLFVDFENVLCNTDEFVCGKLYDLVNEYDDIVTNNPLYAVFEVMRITGKDALPEFSKLKNTINIFRDLIDPSKIEDVEGIDKETQMDMIAEDTYDGILYYDYKNFDEFTFSNIAESFISLIKDENLSTMYIYTKYITSAIHKSIYNLYQSSEKVKIVSGDKGEFLKTTKCDMYIFNDAKDIELLPPIIGTPPKRKVDVLFLNNIPNNKLWETYFIDGDNTHTSVSEKYNASIAFISKK